MERDTASRLEIAARGLANAGSGQLWFYDPAAIANGIQAWWRVL